LAKKISDELRLSPKTTNPSKILHFIAQGLSAENGNRLKAELDSYNFLSQISIQVKHPAWANAALKADPKLSTYFLDASPNAIALGIIANVVYEAICKQDDLFSEYNLTADSSHAIQDKIAKYRTLLPKEQLEFIEDGVFCFYEKTKNETINASGFHSLLNIYLHKLLPLISEKSKARAWWEGDILPTKSVGSENEFDQALKQLQANGITEKAKETLLFEAWSALLFSLEKNTSTPGKWSIDSALLINKKLNKLGWPLRGRNILLAKCFYKKTNTVVDFDLCSSWLCGLIIPDPEQMKIIESITENPVDIEI
jgi:hypothetical protein